MFVHYFLQGTITNNFKVGVKQFFLLLKIQLFSYNSKKLW